MKGSQGWPLIRNLIIEIAVYGTLVTVYSVAVLRLLGQPLVRIFNANLVGYAFLGLLLILAQGVLLDLVTSFLLDRLKIGRLE